MTSRAVALLGIAAPLCAAALHAAASGTAATPAQGQSSAAALTMPRYDAAGQLQLPENWRRWVFVGSSLGLSYNQGEQPGMEMFHETLMEPSAYQHFSDTGTFREGTMFVLVLHGIGESVLPARRGRFAADIHGIEMAVKDSTRRPEGWAYYNFGGMNGVRPIAAAMPKESCYTCHSEHAKRDNVFLQFYPLLEGVAPRSLAASPAGVAAAAATAQRAAVTPPVSARPLAIGGLDPVLLAAGREEMGKPEIVEVYDGSLYQFVSEPNRAAFAREPGRYARGGSAKRLESRAHQD